MNFILLAVMAIMATTVPSQDVEGVLEEQGQQEEQVQQEIVNLEDETLLLLPQEEELSETFTEE